MSFDNHGDDPARWRGPMLAQAGALAVIVGLGLVTLFGPDLPRQDRMASAPLDSPLAPPQALEMPAPSQVRRTATVAAGDTLIKVLRGLGIASAVAHDAIAAIRGVYDPRGLRPGQEVAATYAPAARGDGPGALLGIRLVSNADRDIVLSRGDDGGFVASEHKKPAERELVRVAGVIDSSLYDSGTAAGLPVPVMMEMIRILSWDIDFQRDLRPGDRFELAYERRRYLDGSGAKDGAIQAATLTLGGTNTAVFRFKPSVGPVDYYHGDGSGVRKALLRTPIDGARLSSQYGQRRHPILGYTRMHRGLDFAAPAGTPIYAAGDGVVDAIGGNADYGNYIRIRHTTRHATAYAHLSRYAQGLKRGARLRQGQVVGYVGSTGRSTGPHLHYEVLDAGAQVNPLSVKLASGNSLKGDELLRFHLARSGLEERIAALAPYTRLSSN